MFEWMDTLCLAAASAVAVAFVVVVAAVTVKVYRRLGVHDD